MANNREPKSFEERAESFGNIMANLTCGSFALCLFIIGALLVILMIAAVIFGGD